MLAGWIAYLVFIALAATGICAIIAPYIGDFAAAVIGGIFVLFMLYQGLKNI